MYGYKNLGYYYEEIGNLVQYSNYSYTDLRDMIPYELDVYSAILLQQREKENKAKEEARRGK